jgi:N-acetylglucosaminylphosphatidylinositol deacetylase
VTFDAHGVSGHLNHIACYQGVLELLSQRPELSAYALESTNIVRKFLGAFDILISYFCSSLLQYTWLDLRLNYRAMQAHASQFVWYRRLFIAFARYSFVNTLAPLQLARDPA